MIETGLNVVVSLALPMHPSPGETGRRIVTNVDNFGPGGMSLDLLAMRLESELNKPEEPGSQ